MSTISGHVPEDSQSSLSDHAVLQLSTQLTPKILPHRILFFGWPDACSNDVDFKQDSSFEADVKRNKMIDRLTVFGTKHFSIDI